MKYSAKARLTLRLYRYHLPFALLVKFHSYPSTPKGGIKMPLKFLHFWRLMPKGEKVIGPKQKDRTTTHPYSNFQKLFHKGEEIISNFQKLFHKGRNYFSYKNPLDS
jgi:hypothetical protein